MKFIMLLALLTVTSFAHASCLDSIRTIKEALGTSAGGTEEGILDRLNTNNNLFKRTVEISQNLVSRSYGRPIAASGLNTLNNTLVPIQNGYVYSTANLVMLGYSIDRLEEECADKID